MGVSPGVVGYQSEVATERRSEFSKSEWHLYFNTGFPPVCVLSIPQTTSVYTNNILFTSEGVALFKDCADR